MDVYDPTQRPNDYVQFRVNPCVDLGQSVVCQNPGQIQTVLTGHPLTLTYRQTDDVGQTYW
jgi:hypothetical protein